MSTTIPWPELIPGDLVRFSSTRELAVVTLAVVSFDGHLFHWNEQEKAQEIQRSLEAQGKSLQNSHPPCYKLAFSNPPKDIGEKCNRDGVFTEHQIMLVERGALWKELNSKPTTRQRPI